MAKRRNFTPEFKAELVLEVLSGATTQAELCRRHNLNENQLSQWKQQLVENASTLFDSTENHFVNYNISITSPKISGPKLQIAMPLHLLPHIIEFPKKDRLCTAIGILTFRYDYFGILSIFSTGGPRKYKSIRTLFVLIKSDTAIPKQVSPFSLDI